MIANVESVEVLLQVAFGRGIKYLSTPPDDPNYDRFLQVGEKLCAASLKSFLVSCKHREKKLNFSSPNASPSDIRSGGISQRHITQLDMVA
jgi:hypothetical protein